MSWYLVKRVFATPVASIYAGDRSVPRLSAQAVTGRSHTSDQQRDDCLARHDCFGKRKRTLQELVVLLKGLLLCSAVMPMM